MDKKSFVIYKNWAKLIVNLDDLKAGMLIKAICNHVNGEAVNVEDETIKAIYAMIEEQLDEDAEKYADVVKKRTEAGKKGLKNRWNSVANASKSQRLLGVNDTVTDNVNDNVNDTVTDNKSIRPARHAHGEYKHVRLSDKEYQKLIEDYGSIETEEAIKYLDEYIEMKGAKYKNHNLALRKWVFNAVKEHKPKDPGGDYLLRIIQGGAE